MGVLAQRLCKRLCVHCKEAYHPTPQEYDELVQEYGISGWEPLSITYAEHFILNKEKGCEACNGTGFKGGVPLHELLRGTEDVKNFIQSKTGVAGLRELAIKEGMITLLQDGIRKTLQGMTTYRQVRTVAIK